MRIGDFGISVLSVRTARALERSLERLASGRRINSARDDIGGFHQASRLEFDQVTARRAIRNANDGLSVLQIADGAMNDLSSILQTIRELAVQASNDTLASSDRDALQGELDELLEAFSRVVDTTEYSGIKLLDGSKEEITLRFGTESSFEIQLNDLLAPNVFTKTVGTGSFTGAATLAATGFFANPKGGDFNQDGILDLGVISSTGLGFSVYLGNGDGTYRSAISTVLPRMSLDSNYGDLNGDGILDLIAPGAGTSTLDVLFGNGDGTFKPAVSLATAAGSVGIQVGDINNDGDLDLINHDNGANSVSVFLGNGDGSFQARSTYSVTGVGRGTLADLNQDGALDLIAASGNNIGVLLGNGDGTFRAMTAFTGISMQADVEVADINRDGRLDVIGGMAGSVGLAIYLGNGDGSLQARVQSANGSFNRLEFLDINQDGVLDAVGSISAGGINIRLGNGDGTFAAATTVSTSALDTGFSVADYSGNGTPTLIASTATGLFRFDSFTRTTSALNDLDLSSATKASRVIEIIDSALQNLSTERANVGAAMVGLETALGGLYTKESSLAQAVSNVIDADIALETSELVRNQILQEAQTAMLVQANRLRAQVLDLLS